jgi:hypothetical protein
VKLRDALEEALAAAGVYDRRTQAIMGMVIIVGGTQTQCLHYDASVPNLEPGDILPRSVLVSMGGEGSAVRLGVQKDELEEHCWDLFSINGGKDGEVFRAISETGHVAVLEMKNGVIFDGDVKHYGVGNDHEDVVALMEKVLFLIP